jgi:hypothetical protein
MAQMQIAHSQEQKPKIEYVLFDMDGLLMYASSSLFSLLFFIFSFFHFLSLIYDTAGGRCSVLSPPPPVDQSIDMGRGTLCTGATFFTFYMRLRSPSLLPGYCDASV